MNAMIEKIEVTGVGIQGLDQLNEDDFFAVGKRLSAIEHGLQWAIGDWYNAIPTGDKKAACERAGLRHKSAETFARVCAAISTPTRVGVLSFRHHQVLVHQQLSQEQAVELLEKASKNKWSSNRLKQERDTVLQLPQSPEARRLDAAVDSLADAIRKAMPKSASKKTVNAVIKGMHKVAADLKHDFSEAVEKRAEEKSRIQRDNMKRAQQRADEKLKDAVKMAAGVKAFLSKDEFALIRACLHPDRNPHPNAGKAFDIFNKLADVRDW